MEMAEVVPQEFVTEDMTLVTVLKLRGIEPCTHRRSSGGCQWVFDSTDAVDDVVQEYASGEAYVEPMEFSRKLGLVRTEMYRFLGVKPRRVRS